MKQYKVTKMSEELWNTIEDYDWPEDEILVIEKKDAYCMDITANGKRIVPILRKIEKAMTDAGLAGESGVYAGWFGEWANSLTDRHDRKYFIWNYSGRQDIENGCWSYSWGIEQIDDDRWYIFLNIAKPQEDTPSDNIDEYIEKPTEDTTETTTTESETKEEEQKAMKNEGIKIIDTGLDHIWGSCEFWNNTPRQIENEGIKELTSLDVMALRYAAMELLADDGDEDIFGTMNEVENASAICDNRLYVGNFDGYWLDDDYKLSYFYMHKENRVCAATYSESQDDFQYWLVY